MFGKEYRTVQIIMLIIITFLGYSTWNGFRMTATFTPQIDATMEVKLSATDAHLWLEEILTGDRNEKIQDVWDKLDESNWYVDALLSGGSNSEGNFSPLTDPELRSAITRVKKLLSYWEDIARERYKQSHKLSTSGTKIDQEFDQLFKTFILQTDIVETLLQKKINQTLQQFLILQALLILIAISLFYFLLKNLASKDYVNNKQYLEIKGQEENLRTTLDSIGDAVIATGIDHKINRLNPVAEKLTGWSFEDAKGKPLQDVFKIINASTGKTVEDPVTKVLATGQIQGLANHTILVSKNGTEYHIADSAAPIHSENEEITGVILVFHDVTNEIILQKQINHHNKMDAIGELAGGVAHDFNNMLTAIQGSAQLLNYPEINLNAKGKKYVQMILDASKKAANLTAKLLAFGRKGSIASTAIDVHEIIDDSIAIFNQTLNKNITISCNKSAVFPMIIGDDTALQNALMNLGINSSHAMKNGGEISIKTKNIYLQKNYCDESPFDIEPGQFIDIEFSDTGHGINIELMNNIFEPFFTTKQRGEGTGLGLAVVYGTIQDHSGVITVSSETVTGTTFHLYLPCVEDKVSPIKADRTILIGKGQTILLVDDEEIIRVTCRLMLEEMGYKVILANNGEAAVNIFKLQQHNIDLVIMDMIMPKMGGKEAFFEMKELNNDCNIIVASGFSKEQHIGLMNDAGLSGFLKKPYKDYELSQMVNKILNK